jgi:GTP cyclohydrolase II
VEILEAPMKTPKGKFRLLCFDSGEEHPPVAIVYGEIAKDKPPLVRIQSECLTGHVFNSLTCDCSGQRTDSIDKIVAEGSGILIHLWQEGRGIGLANKVRGYAVQTTQGADTVDANVIIGRKIDERNYDDVATILKEFGVTSIRLLTNNPAKIKGLIELGIDVVETVPLPPHVNELNRRYLETKISKLGHMYELADA